ncbi:MAG TPA: hypothetical protein VNX21_04980, partial [Candidatus Thermoplasmatota archaeon]|nr:hypothetical protein [Candidatus Thermoplasmatota archaeon]
VAFLWMAEAARRAGLALDADVLKALEPDPLGPVHDSRRGVFRLLPARWRGIGEPTHQPQSLHESARARRADASLRYAPPNLEAFLRREAP